MKSKAFFWIGTGMIAVLMAALWSFQLVPLLAKVLISALLLLCGGMTYAVWRAKQKMERQVIDLQTKVQSLEEQAVAKYENLLRISQQFATATDEAHIVNCALELMLDVTNAKAISFTPIDELGATLTTRVQGELPARVSKEWIEYLSSPSVRNKCLNCKKKEKLDDHCPLLYGAGEQLRIYCVPIRRSDQELGIFHLFLDDSASLDKEQESLLRLISDQTALSMEGARLRSREAFAYFQLESVKQQTDVGFFVVELLKSLNQGMDVQMAVVSVWDRHLKKPIKDFVLGELDNEQKNQLYSHISQRNWARLEKKKNHIALEAGGRQEDGTVLTIPIPIGKSDLQGVLQLILPNARELSEKQEEMLKAIVTQISFLLQNANLLAEVEIKAILQERIRLAREIHDGLAQTLGFLKLKVSQLRAYLEQRENERAIQTTQLLYEAISDAYIEARHAIDQLRVSVYDAPLAELLQETLDEFCESTGIRCERYVSPEELRLPMEINAQLVRIVQESLSNVRKHAHARQVHLHTVVKGDWLILEVRDDGIGFHPEEVSRHSQYGLRGMKERAELIGAELQIISKPNEGATVQVRLPLSQIERSWQT